MLDERWSLDNITSKVGDGMSTSFRKNLWLDGSILEVFLVGILN